MPRLLVSFNCPLLTKYTCPTIGGAGIVGCTGGNAKKAQKPDPPNRSSKIIRRAISHFLCGLLFFDGDDGEERGKGESIGVVPGDCTIVEAVEVLSAGNGEVAC